ncbi:MAG: hypothetical protein LRY71_14620 [Bacillaceae bacterium]|nr:hypothetical protein [Bacillaceae bacterium]
MNNKRSSKEKIQSIINTKNIFKGFRITYQVFWNLLLIITVVLVSGLLFVAGTGAGYFAALVKDEPIRSYEEMKADIYDFEEVSEIYFANGELVGEVRSDDVVRSRNTIE